MALISATRLRVRTFRYLPGFFYFALLSARQAKRARGNLGADLLAKAKRTFWTCTAPIEHRGVPNVRAVIAESDAAQALVDSGYFAPRVDCGADHVHFIDNVEQEHETVRTLPWTGELAWIPKEMRPIAELSSGEQAHLFVRGLTLGHMDAILRRREEAQRFLLGDLEAELAVRSVDGIVHKP